MKIKILFILLIMIVSCASVDKRQQFHQQLNASLNVLTYDEALMRWGSPSNLTEGQDIFIATWRHEESTSVALPVGNLMVAKPISHGEELQLTFNRISKKMVHWKNNAW